VAGVIKLSKKGYFKGGETVVCTLTGNGLKDADIVLKVSEEPMKVKTEVSEVEKLLKGIL
jgi:threonine synthase